VSIPFFHHNLLIYGSGALVDTLMQRNLIDV
jgi:hypothetical protein